MKNLMLLALLGLSFSSFASDINSVSVGRWSSYPAMFYSQVAKIEYKLQDYLGKNLDCESVKVCTYQIDRATYNELTEYGRDTWFNGLQYKYYKMVVSAVCEEDFSNFKHKAFFAMDWGETTDVRLGYDLNGRRVKKEFSVDEEDYPNTSGEYDYDDSGCTDDFDI
jgi:hypothetical protein